MSSLPTKSRAGKHFLPCKLLNYGRTQCLILPDKKEQERGKVVNQEGTSVKQPAGTQLKVAKVSEFSVVQMNIIGYLKRVTSGQDSPSNRGCGKDRGKNEKLR